MVRSRQQAYDRGVTRNCQCRSRATRIRCVQHSAHFRCTVSLDRWVSRSFDSIQDKNTSKRLCADRLIVRDRVVRVHPTCMGGGCLIERCVLCHQTEAAGCTLRVQFVESSLQFTARGICRCRDRGNKRGQFKVDDVCWSTRCGGGRYSSHGPGGCRIPTTTTTPGKECSQRGCCNQSCDHLGFGRAF